MKQFKSIIICDRTDQESIFSGSINIEWVNRCLSSKKNRRRAFITIVMWYICLLVFAPAGPMTYLLFQWYWSSTNIDIIPWQFRYVFLVYGLVNIIVLSLIILFVANKNLISWYSILNFYVGLINYTKINEEENNKILNKEIRDKFNEIDRKTKLDLQKLIALLVSKKRIIYRDKVADLCKPVKNNAFYCNKAALVALTVIQLISVVVLIVGGVVEWPTLLF